MSKPTRKIFVEFFSPGTFYDESSQREIPSKDIAAAVEMANGITERYNAKPYGFKFVTCICADPIPDGEGGTIAVPPKEVERSGMHYLGGRVKLYDEIPESRETTILRSNMRCNREPVVVENSNSFRHTAFFCEDQCIVDASGKIVRRGNDADLVEYRKSMNEQFAKFVA
jgi:hypothetical protein